MNAPKHESHDLYQVHRRKDPVKIMELVLWRVHACSPIERLTNVGVDRRAYPQLTPAALAAGWERKLQNWRDDSTGRAIKTARWLAGSGRMAAAGAANL